MKVVFSRKGVDSAAGRCASALVGDSPVSLPIPTCQPTPVTYADLHPELRWFAGDLSGGELAGDRPCHLDPDIWDDALRHRPEGWRGALGQASAALTHLRNQEVGPGDLFLFWGLFRPVDETDGSWHYSGPRQHAMFGWLHVEDVCDVEGDGTSVLQRHPWLSSHPHVRPGWTGANAVFVASKSFTIDGRRFPGSGMFQRAYRLTEEGVQSPSVWSVPSWLDAADGGVGFTYHKPEAWLGGGRLRAASRGQEFVADVSHRPDAQTWIANLLDDHQ